MDPAKRVLINTVAQYSKALINMCLSLYTVRLVLLSLGETDFGISSLIAGVISMLGFITNALVITTQRHLSFYYGIGDKEKARQVFSNSFAIHFCVGICLVLIMLCLKDYFCIEFLNIADDRRTVAGYVYIFSTCILFITFITAPFKAIFIARENIIYISVVEILSSILKLILVLTLLSLDFDKLVIYSTIISSMAIFELLCYLTYSFLNFEECSPDMFIKDIDRFTIKELAGFASWTTYGMGVIIFRNQGVAILINKFFGTVLNASYGIAMQVYGVLSFISSSIVNAMNPQIMQAEGKGHRDKVFLLAGQESKFVSSMMAIIFIPIIFNMNDILLLWLKEIPPYTTFFCQCLLVTFIIDQTTYGLHSANQAIGKLRTYTLIMYMPKLMLPAVFWLLLYFHHPVESVMYVYIAVEALVALCRLPYMKHTAGLRVRQFAKNVFFKIIPLILLLASISFMSTYLNLQYGNLLKIPTLVIIGCLIAWRCTLTSSERHFILGMLKKRRVHGI